MATPTPSKEAANTGRRKPPNAGKGRPKGAKNKTTASIKAALTAAFDKLGGVPALVTWAQENQGDFYKLWGKLVPQEHSGPDGGVIPITVVIRDESAHT